MTKQMSTCENDDTKLENGTACSYGIGCMVCWDCVCPDCHKCKFKHCSCSDDTSDD